MIEQHNINGKDVWIRVDAQPANRENPNLIPTEYFTVAWFTHEPADNEKGEQITEDGGVKLFESPVAALSYARKVLETELSR